MYTVRPKLELSQSEERFMAKCFFFTSVIHNKTDIQTGTKIYKNIEPQSYKKDWIDTIADWLSKEKN